MARTAQCTFQQRIARIEQKANSGRNIYQNQNPMQAARKGRRVHWDMLVFGAMLGGGVGTLFAMSVGLLFVTSLDTDTLYQLVLTDYFKSALIIGVAIAPIGFVMSQLFARGNPRGWQFWIAYLAAILGTNSGDIQTYYHVLTNTAG